MPRKSSQGIPFNEQAVRKVATTKHGAQADYVIRDVPGLMLTCYPSGSASFRVQMTVEGKRRRESIGPWSVITLAAARAKALEVAAGAATGKDVLAVEAKDKAKLTLRQLWDRRVELENDRAGRTMHDYGRALTADVFPTLGNRAAVEITADEFAQLLEKVEDRSKHAARHAKAALSSLFGWAQKRRLVRVNPLATLGFSHQSKPRKRKLSDAEMRRLWLAIDQTQGVTAPIRHIIKLAILTGQRNSEVAGMECAEVCGLDTATPRLDIPARRMKRKSEDQYVPLSRQAAEIVRDALVASSNGLHVFQGSTKGRVGGVWRQRHINSTSVGECMAKVVTTAGLSDVHLHDMRKCVTSWLAEHGHATPEVLDAILHHGKKGVTGSHYNFALYEKQVRAALQIWADHIWHITGQDAGVHSGSADNVVTLATARAQ